MARLPAEQERDAVAGLNLVAEHRPMGLLALAEKALFRHQLLDAFD